VKERKSPTIRLKELIDSGIESGEMTSIVTLEATMEVEYNYSPKNARRFVERFIYRHCRGKNAEYERFLCGPYVYIDKRQKGAADVQKR